MTALQQPLTLANVQGTATVYEQGAHVASWTPAQQDPVLFLSRKAVFAEGKAIRGGVPICFPWFGPGRSGDRSPAHGYARTIPWRPVSATDEEAVFRLTEADLPEQARAEFPHEFSCEYTVTVGAALEMKLATTNTGGEPMEIEEALHAYLAVGDVRQAGVQGLDGVSYVDKVTGKTDMKQSGEIVISGETDRVYRSGGPVSVVDPLLGRTLRITTSGAADTVVWNPWEDNARAIGDFADDEWTAMICVEAANALDDYVTIAPGETHEIVYRLEVGSI
ncbi:D-hexose-6-phosphate mutarotase [Kocuria coralli]|uniref:Putative glucose-6-phosphate 1-epimerase n=1 Tax=Kocuria coralli TaxID=1461025 RepID=A0A5J5L2V7_9MICC|nr:D-hexose-6-phosphate mutarotase [Kocuria coralli]KAA9395341.1 D-hexose-6-phosphate mutarotase [Kocuria coralli]